MNSFHGIELFTRLKYLKKYRKQTFSTLGHHHPDDDVVSKMFSFYLFNILAYFLNLSKLYGQLLAFLYQYLSKNDKILIFLFTYHSQHLSFLKYLL